MLHGIDPLLNGELLHRLSDLGHGDTFVVADANFPAHRLGQRVVELPGIAAASAIGAIVSVVPLDDVSHPACLMETQERTILPIHHELLHAAGLEGHRSTYLSRQEFYDAAELSSLVILTGETKPYGNILLTKGVVTIAQ